MDRRSVWLLVLLVAASGCSGAGGMDSPDSSVTPAPLPDTETATAPAWAPGGTLNEIALLERHRRALDGSYTARVVWNRTIEGRDLEIRRLSVLSTLRVGGDRYRLDTTAALTTDDRRYDIDPAGAASLRLGGGRDAYGFSGREFRRIRDGEAFERRPANATRYRAELRGELAALLDMVHNRVIPVERDGARWYRVEGWGLPGQTVEKDYRMRAVVAPEGSIRRLEAAFLSGRSVIEVRIVVSPAVTVEPPAWLDAARAATTDSSTPTTTDRP